MAVRVKICGITRAADARAAARAGADLLGFNFCPASPRYVGGAERAAELLAAVEPPAIAVAVTVNASVAELEAILSVGGAGGASEAGRSDRRTGGLAVVQLHGAEPPDLADTLIGRGVKVIKAFGVGTQDFAAAVNEWLAAVRRRERLLAVLLDAAGTAPSGKSGERGKPLFGGGGRPFNWEWVAQARQAGELEGWPPLLLAGGLTPGNVAKAIRVVQPWGVDVAGGIESAPGIKSADKIRLFVRNARLG